MANLELGVPITPASVFHVASVSKSFTAMSVLLLAQRGRLSLDDEARQYLTELPNYGNRLTLRHLLSHTGGLRDVFLLQGLAAPRAGSGAPNDEFVDILARQRGLNFTPGTEFEYSNGAYLLLANIVKRVSEQSLRGFADTNIFKPLGMVDTHFHDDPTMIVPNRASGYHLDAGGLQVAIRGDPGGIVGNAGLFTTARDLLLWEQNFADVRVGEPALVAAMQTPTVLTSGDTSLYGFGLEIGEYRGLRTIGHGGGDPGYRAYVVEPSRVRDLGKLDYWYEPLIYDNPLYDWSATVRVFSNGWARLRQRAWDTNRLLADNKFNAASEAFRIQVALMEIFAKAVSERGAQSLVVFFPDKPSAMRAVAGEAPVYTPLVRILQSKGISTLDLAPEFASEAGDRRPDDWFMPGGHYSYAGNRVAARAVLRAVRQWNAAAGFVSLYGTRQTPVRAAGSSRCVPMPAHPKDAGDAPVCPPHATPG